MNLHAFEILPRLVLSLNLFGIRTAADRETEITPDSWDFGKMLATQAVVAPLNEGFSHAVKITSTPDDDNSNRTLCEVWDPRFTTVVNEESGLSMTWHGPVRVEVSHDMLAVDWKYWLEPAELEIDIVLKHNVLITRSDDIGNSTTTDGFVAGRVTVTIRTEFGLCLLSTGFRLHEATLLFTNLPEIPNLTKLVDKPLTNTIESLFSDILIEPGFCKKWLPSSYYDIIKY